MASERCSDCLSSSWLACQTAAAAPMSADSRMIATWKTRIWYASGNRVFNVWVTRDRSPYPGSDLATKTTKTATTTASVVGTADSEESRIGMTPAIDLRGVTKRFLTPSGGVYTALRDLN